MTHTRPAGFSFRSGCWLPLLLASAMALAGTPVPVAAGAPQAAPLQALNGSIRRVVERVSPAVVQIRVTGLGPAGGSGRRSAAYVEHQRSVGSGIIVDPSGYILTNEHVVHGAQRVRVLLPTQPGAAATDPEDLRKRLFEARVVATQADVDLALLKIEAQDLPVISLAQAATARQGDLVFAIGSPEGLASSVTMGVVSAVERQMDSAVPMTFVQTDAPINPGNSGGPLVDAGGALVGINSFILSESGGSQGLGFAIPAPTAKFVYESFRRDGRVRRVEAGIAAQPISLELAAGLGLPRDCGVIVADVEPGGAAQKAGVEPGDILDEVDGRPITSLPALTTAMFLHGVDRPLVLKLLRKGGSLTLTLLAPEASRPTDRLAELATAERGLIHRLGFVGTDLDDKLRALLPPLRPGPGVVVAARLQDGGAAECGLLPGDVLRTLNRTRTDSLETLREALRPLKAGDPVALQVERAGKLLYLAFELE